MGGIERLTLSQVRAIAGLPDTSTAALERGAPSEGFLVPGSVLGTVAALSLPMRRRVGEGSGRAFGTA